jgi:hypothetical protein
MRFYNLPPGGNDHYNAPDGIRRLPMTLWRSSLYPRQPKVVAAAAQEYLEDAPLPIAYMPQRMGFTRWKTPPYDVAWGSSVVALLNAMEQGLRAQYTLQAAGMSSAPVETSEMAVARLHANRLPQVSDNEDPNINAHPVARNALPLDRITTAKQLNDYVYMTRANLANGHAERSERQQRAMAAVSEQSQGIAEILGDNSQKPWFMR